MTTKHTDLDPSLEKAYVSHYLERTDRVILGTVSKGGTPYVDWRHLTSAQAIEFANNILEAAEAVKPKEPRFYVDQESAMACICTKDRQYPRKTLAWFKWNDDATAFVDMMNKKEES